MIISSTQETRKRHKTSIVTKFLILSSVEFFITIKNPIKVITYFYKLYPYFGACFFMVFASKKLNLLFEP